MPRTRKEPDPLKPPARAVCVAIVSRFLKPDQTIYWPREMPTWYALWKQYPNLSFWNSYHVPFGDGTLNHMTWFETPEGAADLARAWVLYNWTPPEEPIQSDCINTLDSTTPTKLPCALPPRKPRSVAEWLRQT